MTCKNAPKINRGQLRAAKKSKQLNVAIEPAIKLEIGSEVRITTRATWGGKHGELMHIAVEHGMNVARVRLHRSHHIVRVPVADLISVAPGREFVPQDVNPNVIWNPMQSPFASPSARVH